MNLKPYIQHQQQVAIIGLGYIGLPLALEFAKAYQVIGFDIDDNRVQLLNQGIDPSSELSTEAFAQKHITFTSDPALLDKASIYIICVPTDIDKNKTPELTPLKQSSHLVGQHLSKGDIVVYESTVYPGCTEEVCIPILEQASGLRYNTDFFVGYSPERIVPGDKARPITSILKVVSGSKPTVTHFLGDLYGSIITAGIKTVSSIKVAEAAKVIENTQRDLNISLMNELAIIFDRMDIDIHEVLDAAATKWNFHSYYPGLVGGHCIGVDPYYLIYKANYLGIHPEVIAAGRRINDSIPHFIASKLTKKLLELEKSTFDSRVLVMGVTFKENVADIRNSKVLNLVEELKAYSLHVDVVDPRASAADVSSYAGITLSTKPSGKYDAIILAVSHDEYLAMSTKALSNLLIDRDGIIFDIKGILDKTQFDDIHYWKL